MTAPMRQLPRNIRIMLLAILALVVLALAAACNSTPRHERDEGTLPWNRPADWESGMIGIPY